MSYEDMRYFQQCEEAGPEGVPPPALSWTASEMEGWDEDDHEAARLAMDRNMAEREHYWQRRAEAAESRLRELEEGYEYGE